MSIFQIIMLLFAVFFAYQVYKHIHALDDVVTPHSSPEGEDERPKESVEHLIEKADEAFMKGKTDESLRFLYNADSQEPKNAEILGKIGYILASIEENDAALEYYQKALAADAGDYRVHNAMASLYRKQGRLEDARSHLDTSLALYAKDRVTYYNYGNLLVDMQRPQEAADMYKKALQIDPDFTEAKVELEALGQQG
jgi:tetratricopeptide (TPR) repeat protein